jgi:hypothetical protein
MARDENVTRWDHADLSNQAGKILGERSHHFEDETESESDATDIEEDADYHYCDHDVECAPPTISQREFGETVKGVHRIKARLTADELKNNRETKTPKEREDEPERPRHRGRVGTLEAMGAWLVSVHAPHFTYGGDTWKRLTQTEESAKKTWNTFNKRAMGMYEFNHRRTYRLNRKLAQTITGADVDWRFSMQEDSMSKTYPETSVVDADSRDQEVRHLTETIHRLNFPLRKRTITPDYGEEHKRLIKEFMICRLFNLRQQYIRRQTSNKPDYETLVDIEFNAGIFSKDKNADGSYKVIPQRETERCYQCGVGDNLVTLRPCTKCHVYTGYIKDATELKGCKEYLPPARRPMFCGINCQEIFRETVHAIPQGSCHGMIPKMRTDGTNCFIYPGCDNQNDPALYYDGILMKEWKEQETRHVGDTI